MNYCLPIVVGLIIGCSPLTKYKAVKFIIEIIGSGGII